MENVWHDVAFVYLFLRAFSIFSGLRRASGSPRNNQDKLLQLMSKKTLFYTLFFNA